MSPIDRIARFRRDDTGVVAIIVSLMLTVLFGFVALGVDVAALYRDRAALQAVSDLGAMSAVADASAARSRAEATITLNGRDASTLTNLQTGRYLRNPAIPRDQRFTPLQEDTPLVNAARITLTDDSPLYFAQIFSDRPTVALYRTAMATRTGAVSFALDSHLAALDGATLNAVLASRFGAGARIEAGDIALLAGAEVNLGALTRRVEAMVGAASANPADILNVTTTAGLLLDALRAELPASLAPALAGLDSAVSDQPVDMAALVGGIDTGLGLTVTDFLAQIDLPALDVVKAIAGARALTPAVDIAAGAGVPGVLGVAASLSSGEPPAQSGWVALGEEGAELHRAAARLSLDIAADPTLLTGLAPEVTATALDLPVYVELAGSTATLDRISCQGTRPGDLAASFSTWATPLHPANGTAIAALYLGQLPAGTGPGQAIDPLNLGFADLLTVRIVIPVPLLPDLVLADLVIQARSHTALGASGTERIAFTRGDIAAGDTTRSFGSEQLVTSAVTALLSSGNTELRVKPAQEGLVSGLAAPVVETLLATLPSRLVAALGAPVDGVIDSALDATGLELGTGALTLTGHHCERIRLIQ